MEMITNSRVALTNATVNPQAGDFEIIVNKTTAAATPVTLPASPENGLVYVYKDGKGDAATNNITITPAAGTIDGLPYYVINTAYGSVELLYNGVEWSVRSSHKMLWAASRKPQIVTSRNAVITSSRLGTLGGRTDVRNESRVKMYIGNQPVSQIQFGIGGFQLTNNGEVAFANSFNQEFAMELASPVTYQEAAFGMSIGPTAIPPGLPYTLTNPIGFDIAAGGNFYLRQAASIANDTLYLPLSLLGSMATGDNDYLSNAGTSQIPGTGALTAPSGAGVQTGALPLLTLGIPAAPMAAVIFCGDSIAAGSNDISGASSFGSIGYIQRGLDSVNGNVMPWMSQCIPSLDFQHFTKQYAPACRSLWPFATHLLIQLGTNDICIDGASLATMQAYVTEMCTAAKRTIGPYGKPMQTAVIKIIPRCNSTDNYATAANQTPVSGFAVGGIRDQYNSWLSSQVGLGLIDAVVDPNVYLEDPAHHGCWVSNGTASYYTTDGTHPSTVGAILAAPAVTAWAQTITP